MHLAPSTVLLVSVDHINSLGLHALLTEQAHLRLLDDVGQPEVAVQLATRHRPDQIVVDADVDGMGLVPFVRAVRRASPDSRIVVVGSQDTLQRDTLLRLTELGVRGYLLWTRLSREAVVLCLAIVLLDDLLVGHRIVLDELLAAPDRRRHTRGNEPVLTEDERTVLKRLATGLTQREIAETEHVSERKVRRIVGGLQEKFDASSLFVLGMQAVRRGFIS